MTEAFVFDAVRTPRGKGKKDGSLHEVKPVDLLAGTLEALRARHDFDPPPWTTSSWAWSRRSASRVR
jgi:acetyl-CoA acetyltransferase